jgi:hypothetical protein
MIFSFTTQGREGVGAADYGLCAATTGNALVPSVVNTYRSGFRPVPAVMPLGVFASPGWRSQTVGGCFTALPAFFFRDCCGGDGVPSGSRCRFPFPFAVYAGQCRHGTISGISARIPSLRTSSLAGHYGGALSFPARPAAFSNSSTVITEQPSV